MFWEAQGDATGLQAGSAQRRQDVGSLEPCQVLREVEVDQLQACKALKDGHAAHLARGPGAR